MRASRIIILFLMQNYRSGSQIKIRTLLLRVLNAMDYRRYLVSYLVAKPPMKISNHTKIYQFSQPSFGYEISTIQHTLKWTGRPIPNSFRKLSELGFVFDRRGLDCK